MGMGIGSGMKCAAEWGTGLRDCGFLRLGGRRKKERGWFWMMEI